MRKAALLQTILIIGSLLLLVFCTSFFLKQESENYSEKLVFISSDETSTELKMQKVEQSSFSDEGYVLVLPAGDDIHDVRLSCSKDFSLKINLTTTSSDSSDSLTFHNGDVLTGVEAGQTYSAEICKSGNPFSFDTNFTVYALNNVPTIFIDLPSGSLRKISRERGKEETGMLIACNADGIEENEGSSCKVRIHGNTSWDDAKHSLAVHLSEESGILGLPAEKKWLLISNYEDPSYLKNAVAYTLADDLGFQFAPKVKFVNLYVCGEYQGVYLLTQKIDIAGGCVDLPDIETRNKEVNESFSVVQAANFEIKEPYSGEDDNENRQTDSISEEDNGKYLLERGLSLQYTPEDLTGGWLMELCGRLTYEENDCGFSTPRRYVALKSPNNANETEISLISEHIREAEESLYSSSGKNESTDKSYSEYYDLPSFAEQFLMQEFFRNGDAELNSEYIWWDSSEDSDGLIHAGPGWDFDKTFWQITADGQTELNSLHIEGLKDEFPYEEFAVDGKLYLPQMYTKPEFRKMVQGLYKSKFSKEITYLLNAKIPEWKDEIGYSAAVDRMLWKNSDSSFESDVDDVVRKIAARQQFLDSYWGNEENYTKITFVTDNCRFNLVWCVPKGTVISQLPQIEGVTGWTENEERSGVITEAFTADKDVTLYEVY